MAADPLAEITSDDHRRALIAMRDKLAADFVDAPPNVVAQVAARLQAVLEALAALPAEKATSVADELRAKRDERRAS